MDVNDSNDMIPYHEENNISNNFLSKLVNENVKVNKPPGNKTPRVQWRIQMIVDHQSHEVIKDLVLPIAISHTENYFEVSSIN